MWSKLKSLSKNDKKLVVIVSSVAGGLVLAVISVAIIIGITREDSDYPHIADNGYGSSEEPAFVPPRLGVPPEEWYYFPIAPTALGRINIEALSTTDFGVAVDSAFLISSETQTLTSEHLKNYLSSRCGTEFTLEAQANNTFVLNFSEEQSYNTIINLVYQPSGYAAASHAFQTTDIFRISATTPARNTHGIPPNTGIEITFSQPLSGGIVAFEEAFLIEPPAEGQFLQRDNTYIFAPSLEFGTTYTVSIRAGLEGITGDILAENFGFSFTTQWGTATALDYSISGNAYETFLPWNEVFVAMNVSTHFDGRDFIVDVYDLQTSENFINFDGTERGVLLQTHGIEITEFFGDFQNSFFLFLGEPLPVGYYLLEIRSRQSDIVAHKFIQVSPISVYSISVDAESVFWVHDAASGEPAQGARIIIDGTTAGVTNSEGIAIVNTQNNRRANITIEYANYLPFAYTKPTFGERTLLPSERFLSYMYTDRPQYRPTDTIDVFGVIKPLYGRSHSPDDIFTLRVGDMIEMPIELDAHNSFVKRIPISNMFGHSDVTVEVNGERLMSAWISFFDYTNLSFVMTGELDRVAYNLGDYAHAEVLLTTFAGRPAEGVALIRDRDMPNIYTDERGIATESIAITDNVRAWANNWPPYWTNFRYSVASDAQVSQSIHMPFIVVPRNIMLEHEFDGGTLTVYTSEILTDRINEQYRDARAWSHISPDSFRGAPVDIDFQIEITRYVTTRTVHRQQYDHINRRMITTYNFETDQAPYRTIEARTENGRAVLTGLPVSNDPLIRYRMEARYYDANGRETHLSIWHGGWHSYYQESTIRHFNFSVDNRNLAVGETTMVSIHEGDDIHWGWWHYPYNMPDSTPLTDGRMLAVLVRDGILSAQAGPVSGVPVTFTEAAISNAFLYGAYFDGQNIFPVNNPTSLNFDHMTRELEIDLSFDRENYSPGDDVTVTIQSSRRAQILISVVDESSFQGMRHVAEFLPRFYRSSEIWHWHMNVYQFASHRQHNFGSSGGGAEGGGGDNGGYNINFRDMFVDNPIFEIVQTDANGNATFTFTLPDQVTSWRVTAIGLSADGYAGDTVENIISYLDFYADLLFTNEYIVGDDIVALARAVGGGDVSFTFNVLRDDEIIFTDLQSTTTGRMVFNAGKLPAGEYTMQLIAVSGDQADAVEVPFTVAQSGMIIQSGVSTVISQESPVNFNPDDFNMRDFPVRVTLTNANIRPLTRILHNASNSSSFRTDYIAGAAFRDYFFSGDMDVHAIRALIHSASGGVAELIYEEADFFYTARFVASFPEFVDRDRVVRYIISELADNETPVHRAAALLAMAGVGEPVLLQIRDEIENLNTNDELIIMYLAAALVAIGDDAGAEALIARDAGEAAAWSASGRETAEALRFFVNTAVNPAAAWEHVNRDSANRYVSDVSERINFVRRVRLLGGTVSEFTYYHNGQTHTARLENFDRLHKQLTHDQFLAFNVTPIVGETNYHIDFYAYDSTGWHSEDDRVQVSRTISRDGELYRVEITVTFPPDAYGSFTIYDRMPSNTRFVPLRQRHTPGLPWFSVRHTQRQLVEINLWLRRGDYAHPRTRTVSYHVMELFEADMAPGVTYVTNRRLDNHLWGRTR